MQTKNVVKAICKIYVTILWHLCYKKDFDENELQSKVEIDYVKDNYRIQIESYSSIIWNLCILVSKDFVR